MRKITHKAYVDKIEEKYKGEYSVVSMYQGMEKAIRIRHNTCGNEYNLKHASTAYYHKTVCTECRYSYIDIDYPKLAMNFNNISKAHIVKSSKEIVELICPCCKEIVEMKANDYVRYGYVACDTCSEGYTYPEKFVACLLKQLDVSYIRQYKPQWLGNYRYDFKFIYQGNRYIVETDGGIGHGYNDAYGKDKDESLWLDRHKDTIAQEHGFNVIRIDCNYKTMNNRMNYIKAHVQNKLSNIFDLSNVDWEKCNLFALESIRNKVLDIYKNKTVYTDEIADIIGISRSAVDKYLKDAMNANLIPQKRLCRKRPTLDMENPAFVNTDISVSWGKPVYCYEDAKIFQSISDAARHYCVPVNNMTIALNCYDGFYKGRHFIFLDQLPEDFDFVERYFPEKPKGVAHMVAQYKPNGVLCRVYFRLNEIPKCMNCETIKRCARGERKTAYGYIWKYVSKKDEFEIIHLISLKSDIDRSYFLSQ